MWSDDPIFEYFKKSTVTRDFFDVFIGERIDHGSSRHVYECRHNKNLVCKVETESGAFQNVLEQQVWSELEYSDLAKWFAPIRWISANGVIILQDRTEPIPRKSYPKKVPHFFTDTKYPNFGLLNGKFVCHDYGTFPLTNGFTKRMVNADWWES